MAGGTWNAQGSAVGRPAAAVSESALKELIVDIEREADARHAYHRVQQRLNVYRARGVEIPETLVRMERALALDCMAESQGR